MNRPAPDSAPPPETEGSPETDTLPGADTPPGSGCEGEPPASPPAAPGAPAAATALHRRLDSLRHWPVRELALIAGVSARTINRFFKDPAQIGERMRRKLESALGELPLRQHDGSPPTPAPGAPAAETGHAALPQETDRTPALPERRPEAEPLPPCEVYELNEPLIENQDQVTCAVTPDSPARLTITEIAQLAGVSTKTISRYLNDSPLLSTAMRERVEAVVSQTGFVPNAQARALALRRNFLIALVHAGGDRAVRDAVEDGMLDAMAGSDLALVVHRLDGDRARDAARANGPTAHDEAEGAPDGAGRISALQDFLARHSPSGIVVLPPLAEQAMIAQVCERAQVRCVRLGRSAPALLPAAQAPLPPGGGIETLASNDRAAMAQIVHWLVELGHHRIGLVGGPESSLCAQERELGYLDAMADHDLDRGPALIEAGDNSFASGIAAGHLLLEVSPRPSAIVAANDAMATGVIHAAAAAGLAVPDDLSVVGFDDSPLAAMTCPPLTSMQVPWRAMGREAVRRLRRESPASHAVTLDTDRSAPAAENAFAARLVERGSVRALVRPAPARAILIDPAP
ncbi:LacI family transcriptional regulator [Novosphingobium sp. 1949]|uniref:LacI family transcriptional regulator n=1 Tax=Novosphingobium organovorum TaxID=2930092 RepID=A0ABT0BG78_9SPHN|nr:LacI family DNA-binding transcriptional regulator [Novosphingobium organovorum]MCJ2183779.1 LacI family transcriptional regulator [Novosphingobium organovorum]